MTLEYNKNDDEPISFSSSIHLSNDKSFNVRNLLDGKQEFFLPPSLNPRSYGKIFKFFKIFNTFTNLYFLLILIWLKIRFNNNF